MKTKIFLIVFVMLFVNCQKKQVFPQCLTGIVIGTTDGCNTLIKIEKTPIGKPYELGGTTYENVVQTMTDIKSVKGNRFYFTYRIPGDPTSTFFCLPYPNSAPPDLPYIDVLNLSTSKCP